jgi:hypothetical protein
MISPPTIAPGIEVNPPRISTGSALSAMTWSANDTSERAPHMMPVTSATMPAVNQTMTQIWFSEIPTESAALWLSATARSARPIRVLEKNTASAAIISDAITAAATSMCWMRTGPPRTSISLVPWGRNSSLAIIFLGLPPKISSPSPIKK